jgi:DNA topoisomerase-3
MPFSRIASSFGGAEAMWHVSDKSRYMGRKDLLYKEEGLLDKKEADSFNNALNGIGKVTVKELEKNTEKKAPPLLYNLAELQADCSKILKITPDETLACAQELYEKKLTTYPRTDARVITKAVAKVINKNINGLTALSDFGDERLSKCAEVAKIIMDDRLFEGIEKKKYVNDKKVSDHYAIIPTGQIKELKDVKTLSKKVYQLITERFLQIFFGPVLLEKTNITAIAEDGRYAEEFTLTTRKITGEGWYCVKGVPDNEKQATKEADKINLEEGHTYNASFTVKSGKTTPPKRYDSGSIILAMENAGNLIEDEELREQIKGSGIGTSATRANIIKDLVKQNMLKINKKTQIITPTLKGEGVYEVVLFNIKPMLSAEMTANWDMGLSYVARGKLKKEAFRSELEKSVEKYVGKIKGNDFSDAIKKNLKIISKRYR